MDTIGKYELRQKLGQGGMGEVWLARDPTLDIEVAIKTLPEAAVERDPTYRDRFLQEARTAARINHPNVVRILGADTDDDLHYIVMEYVPGGTVRALIEENGRLPVERAIDIACSICDALEAAAEHAIIHRDIKPENIMLDAKGTPKLADLGLAKQTAGPDSAMVTTEGSAIGTPAYMSPEQGQDSRSVDARADIYSLGATLYHMVTGELPFKAATPLALMLKHVRAELPDPRTHVPDLSPALCDLICKAMAKDPDDRQQSAADLRCELRNLSAEPEGQSRKGPNIFFGALMLLFGIACIAPVTMVIKELLKSEPPPAAPPVEIVEPVPGPVEPEPDPTPAPAPAPPPTATYFAIDLDEPERTGELAVAPDLSDERWRTSAILLRAIPAGSFTMGAPEGEAGFELANNKETAHEVSLSGFYIGVFEITRGQFERIRGGPIRPHEVAFPRDHVTWDGAREFCESVAKANGRKLDLPTEAQWEYACRAGATTAYGFGDDPQEMGRFGNCRDQASERTDGGQWFEKTDAYNDGFKQLSHVGSLAANAWGLFDMHGNVFELCRDSYSYDLGATSQTDPFLQNDGPDRVIRGGSFDRNALAARCAARVPFAQVGHTVYVGFRIVMEL